MDIVITPFPTHRGVARGGPHGGARRRWRWHSRCGGWRWRRRDERRRGLRRQAGLRKLLAGDAYADTEAAIKAAVEDEDFDEAITIVFSSGILPLIHALIGFRRSLPGNALVDLIVEPTRPPVGRAVVRAVARTCCASTCDDTTPSPHRSSPSLQRALGDGEAPLYSQTGANPPTHPRQLHCRGTGVLLGCQLGARWCLASSLS